MLYDANKEKTSFKNSDFQLALSRVGMDSILQPVKYQSLTLVADIQAFVNLKDLSARGVHMSRLYNLVSQKISNQNLSFVNLENCLTEFINSQEGLSDQALLAIHFELPLMRKSLKTATEAFKTYKVKLLVIKDDTQGIKRVLGFQVPYSSTCPQSAALARQLIQDKFQADFLNKDLDFDSIHQWLGSTQGIVATPHAQRSYADVLIQLSDDHIVSDSIDFEYWLDGAEQALGTPVQALVKRADEQEFALLNGQNLMFCEDAARKIGAFFAEQIKNQKIQHYYAKLSHHESLHAHNATAYVQSDSELQKYFSPLGNP